MKCLTATFRQNEYRSDIYDIQTETPDNFPFTFFRLSTPRNGFLIKQNAHYVAESYRNNVKVLFTGLRPIAPYTYKGDLVVAGKKKRSLIIFRHYPADTAFTVFLFPNRNPRNIQPIINEILAYGRD